MKPPTPQNEHCRIIVDDRERCSGIHRLLEQQQGFRVVLDRLPVGDYVVPGAVVIERKTVVDFARSVISGRLFQQATRILRCDEPRKLLILEGSTSTLMNLPISRAAFQGAMVSMVLVFGLPVLHTNSAEDSAELIRIVTHQIRKKRSRPIRRASLRLSGLAAHQAALLQAIPGVGPDRAVSLLDAFGSPERVASASIDELVRIDGIGPVTARQIHDVFCVMDRQPPREGRRTQGSPPSGRGESHQKPRPAEKIR